MLSRRRPETIVRLTVSPGQIHLEVDPLWVRRGISNILSKDRSTMFTDVFCSSSLSRWLFPGAAWATSVFVNVSSFNPSGTTDLQAFPTGVSPLRRRRRRFRGGVNGRQCQLLRRVLLFRRHGRDLFRMASALSYSGATYSHAVGSNMNDQGNFTSTVFQATPQVQWLTTNQARLPLISIPSPAGADNKSAASGLTTITTSAACTPDAPPPMAHIPI